MTGSVNKVSLLGHVGKVPEIRHTQDGRSVANLSLATSEVWTDKNSGERREQTEWHRIVVFSEGLCKVMEQYVNKGSKLYLEGQLQTRKWQDQSGQDRYTTEVILKGFNGRLVLLGGRNQERQGGESDHNAYRDAKEGRDGLRIGGLVMTSMMRFRFNRSTSNAMPVLSR